MLDYQPPWQTRCRLKPARVFWSRDESYYALTNPRTATVISATSEKLDKKVSQKVVARVNNNAHVMVVVIVGDQRWISNLD